MAGRDQVVLTVELQDGDSLQVFFQGLKHGHLREETVVREGEHPDVVATLHTHGQQSLVVVHC